MDNRFKILQGIKSPADLKKLDKSELDPLCAEIRDKLIETVSKNGGHLASNLGTVELTVAIHRVFDAPDDKIIWDVSHQAYTHKLLTGRFDQFDSIRTEGGISGFTRPDESEYDTFYEGHAGTSVSQAVGIAAANRIKGIKDYTVAIIGDGSFGNGMVYEAMNAVSASDRLIIILNDNQMSISESVGSMARKLAVVRSKPEYYRFKARTEKALNYIPLIGKPMASFLFKIKTLLKSIIYKSSYFEDMGFRYIGPVDGHDIDTLCEAMNSAKMVGKPVLIHVNTMKGKGYNFAEKTPEIYHGVSEFNIYTGKSKSSGSNYSKEFGKYLMDFASKDKRICAVTAAMSIGTGLEEFFEKYPDRSFDVGIAEEHAVTFCSGLSAQGMIPVFAVYSTFLQRAVDQIIHDGALQRRKMIIAVDRAGFVGEDGETHQGLYDVSILSGIPNVTIYSPSSYNELSSDLYNALYKDSNVVIIRYPRGSMPEFDGESDSINPIEVIGDNNTDICVVTYGRLFYEALKCYESLCNDYNIKVVKLNRIKPVDAEAIEIISQSKNVYFFEEGVKIGGIGETLLSQLNEFGFNGKYTHIAVNDEFVSHAPVSSLLKKYGLDSESMIRIIKKDLNDE